MTGPYNLPHLTFVEQAEQLEANGLIIDDRALAARWLERIGYYRLRPYWVALRDEVGEFRAGATLAYAVDLYLFDCALRQNLLVALERLEVAMRVYLSHAIGRRDVIGHRYLGCMNARKAAAHAQWLIRADAQLDECREQWLKDFQRDFTGPVPTWMAVEAWSFGTVSKLFPIMNVSDRASIAKRFAVNPDTFESWLRAAATLRNSCAHHNRVWNKPLIDQPAVPKTWEARSVQHIAQGRNSETRTYAMLAVLAHCLSALGNSSAWAQSTRSLAETFPEDCGITLADAGFPSTWKAEPIWN